MPEQLCDYALHVSHSLSCESQSSQHFYAESVTHHSPGSAPRRSRAGATLGPRTLSPGTPKVCNRMSQGRLHDEEAPASNWDDYRPSQEVSCAKHPDHTNLRYNDHIVGESLRSMALRAVTRIANPDKPRLGSWKRIAMSTALRLTVVGILLSLPSASQAEEDPHNKLVYSRYSRQCQPTAYKVRDRGERAQLDHPATKEDVENGDAIFSFEGLGKRRVWKIDVFPSRHRDVHKDSRIGATVWQAEEVEVDGKWKRYYGVLCDGLAAVIPADEWDAWWPDAPWVPFQQDPFRLARSPLRVLRVTLSRRLRAIRSNPTTLRKLS